MTDVRTAPLYSAQDFDTAAVSIPTTGMAAFAPAVAANVIPDNKMGETVLPLTADFRSLGLFKTDGGPQIGRDDSDAIEFFQSGYKISGDSTVTLQLGLAEDNPNVNILISGKAPDSNGVTYVDASLPDDTFILLQATRYKSGIERRRMGVARVQSVEVDQETRGEIRGMSVTFEWLPSPLFDDHPYKEWTGYPGGVELNVTPNTKQTLTKVGATVDLVAKVTPAGVPVHWVSADEKTATVSPKGRVTAVKVGDTTVTARAGGKEVAVQIHVN